MKNKKGLIILCVLAGISLILGGTSFVKKIKDKTLFKPSFSFSASNSLENFDEDFEDETSSGMNKILSLCRGNKKEEVSPSTKKPYVAVIYITGVISEANETYNQKWLLKQIKKAAENQNNRGILLCIDSPGGTVYESDEAYLALKDYHESTNRPVLSYFGSLTASGGYYIACASEYIYANRNCLTGSIGVIAGEHIDITGLLDKAGIRMTTITTGKNKNMGNVNEPLSKEQREIMQSIADEAYEQFTEIVADSRKMKIEEVRKLADGRIYTAKQAKKNGLINEICSFEKAKDEIRNHFLKNSDNDDSEKKGEEVEFVEYKYYYEENLLSLFKGISSFIKDPTSAVYKATSLPAAKCFYLYR